MEPTTQTWMLWMGKNPYHRNKTRTKSTMSRSRWTKIVHAWLALGAYLTTHLISWWQIKVGRFFMHRFLCIRKKSWFDQQMLDIESSKLWERRYFRSYHERLYVRWPFLLRTFSCKLGHWTPSQYISPSSFLK